MTQDHYHDATPPQPEPAARYMPSNEARTWAMLAHLSALSGFVIPFGNLIVPLIIWSIKKDEYRFVDEQGKESLNFQLTIWIAMLVCIPLTFICIGFILMAIIAVAELVLIIIAAVKSYNGEPYRYPLTLRLI